MHYPWYSSSCFLFYGGNIQNCKNFKIKDLCQFSERHWEQHWFEQPWRVHFLKVSFILNTQKDTRKTKLSLDSKRFSSVFTWMPSSACWQGHDHILIISSSVCFIFVFVCYFTMLLRQVHHTAHIWEKLWCCYNSFADIKSVGQTDLMIVLYPIRGAECLERSKWNVYL